MVANLSGLLNALLDISKSRCRHVVTVAREPWWRCASSSVDLPRPNSPQEARQRGLEWRVVDPDLTVDSDPMMLRSGSSTTF
jgi:hypothetical protein